MKKVVFFLLFLLNANLVIQAQQYVILETSNLKAQVNKSGIMFHDSVNSKGGLEVISPDDTVPIAFASTMWFAGIDSDDRTYASVPTYGYNSEITSGTVINSPWKTSTLQTQIKITKDEIDYHKANYAEPGYVMPTSIANWPAHGDQSIGELKNIALRFMILMKTQCTTLKMEIILFFPETRLYS